MKISLLLKYLVIWQIFIVAITLLAMVFIPFRDTYLGGATQAYLYRPLLYSRANFDGNHYLTIAQYGYGFAQQAFFPLYPQLISLLKPFLGTYINSAIIISLVSFTIGMILFVKLLRLDFSAPVVRWIVIALLIFPVSFFFSFVYTEGLFFLLVISTFYLARKDQWLLASVAGFLAAYTRFAGVFLFAALFLELWQQHQLNLRRLVPLLLIPLGLFLYMNFLHRTTGDYLAFIHEQALFHQGRSQNIILLYQVFWRYGRMLLTVNRSDPLFLTIVLEAGTGLLFFITSVISLFRYRLSYSVFGFCCYLLPTLTGTFTSVPRYALICFPSFLLIGEAFAHSQAPARRIFFLGSAFLFIVFLSLFIRGYWVS